MVVKYDILVPPFDRTPEQMTVAQTKKYFEWYISQIPSRVDYVSVKCEHSLRLSKGKINLSPESLILVWKWFISIAEIEEISEERLNEYRKSMSGMPESFIEHMVGNEKTQFSLITSYIIRDIGMYLGQVFINNHNNLKWEFYTKPKSDFFVNRPVIKGFEDKSFEPPFKPSFEPIHMVTVQAANIFDKTESKYDLFKLYSKWKTWT